jgi:hypothetical protein
MLDALCTPWYDGREIAGSQAAAVMRAASVIRNSESGHPGQGLTGPRRIRWPPGESPRYRAEAGIVRPTRAIRRRSPSPSRAETPPRQAPLSGGTANEPPMGPITRDVIGRSSTPRQAPAIAPSKSHDAEPTSLVRAADRPDPDRPVRACMPNSGYNEFLIWALEKRLGLRSLDGWRSLNNSGWRTAKKETRVAARVGWVPPWCRKDVPMPKVQRNHGSVKKSVRRRPPPHRRGLTPRIVTLLLTAIASAIALAREFLARRFPRR